MAKKDYSALLESAVWSKVEGKLLSSVRDGAMKNQLHTVLENTRRSLLADTTVQNVSYIPKLVLPLVRRVFPKLIANNIISTQALQGPSGIIRFLDSYIEGPDGERIKNGSPFGEGNVYPWGAGNTDYSGAAIHRSKWLAGNKAPEASFADHVQKGLPVADLANKTELAPGTSAQFTGNFNYVVDTANKVDFFAEGTLYLMAAPVDATFVLADAFRVATVDRNGVIQQLNPGVKAVAGVMNAKTTDYVISVTASDVTVLPGTGEAITGYIFFWEYRKDNQANILFGGEDTARNGKNINTMTFDITKITVNTKSRKLGAKYSFELMEDYQSEFGEKFEDKVVDYLTTTILTEIDKEVIQLLSDSATWTATWDAKQPVVWTRGVNAWYETIMPVINGLSNTIYERTTVGGATFLVCNPVTATIFQGLNTYAAQGNPVEGNMNVGTVSIGTINNGMNVYVSPMCRRGEIILGFKGKNPEDTGAIYAPYVPVQLQPITYNEGMQALLARSRYWMGVLRPDYYAKLNVTNLFTDAGIAINGEQYKVSY